MAKSQLSYVGQQLQQEREKNEHLATLYHEQLTQYNNQMTQLQTALQSAEKEVIYYSQYQYRYCYLFRLVS